MEKFGYKIITVKNWNEPDRSSVNSFHRKINDGIVQADGDDWVKVIMRPKLTKRVPKDVRALYEVTRSSMIYGYYYYPLYTLCTHQLTRVCEAAVIHKCQELNIKENTFKNKIIHLYKLGIIPEAEHEIWHAVRDLRNIHSHPKSQSIYGPGQAIAVLENVTKMINYIYK